ncbi:MAG: hypothetical protein NVS9B1_13170 [Candidatus Dormibacteraceae bacterium]
MRRQKALNRLANGLCEVATQLGQEAGSPTNARLPGRAIGGRTEAATGIEPAPIAGSRFQVTAGPTSHQRRASAVRGRERDRLKRAAVVEICRERPPVRAAIGFAQWSGRLVVAVYDGLR